MCSLCDESFPEKHDLVRHMETFHPKKLPHKCDRCPKVFKERRMLIAHMKKKHDVDVDVKVAADRPQSATSSGISYDDVTGPELVSLVDSVPPVAEFIEIF